MLDNYTEAFKSVCRGKRINNNEIVTPPQEELTIFRKLLFIKS